MPYERYWTVIFTKRRFDLPMGQAMLSAVMYFMHLFLPGTAQTVPGRSTEREPPRMFRSARRVRCSPDVDA